MLVCFLLVECQGCLCMFPDSIEAHVDETQTHVEQGTRELAKAREYQVHLFNHFIGLNFTETQNISQILMSPAGPMTSCQ